MPYRRLWWLAALLLVHEASADSQCPCVSPDACHGSADSEKSYTSCEDPTTVRCCNANDHSSPSSIEPLQIVTEDLEQEQKFMKALETLMKKMQNIAIPEGENRDDKSLIGSTSKNSLDCDGKQCENPPGEISNKANQQPLDNLETSSNKSKVPLDSQMLESLQSSSAREERDEGEARNKVVIVYAEKPNKNNTYEEERFPHVVYPSKEGMEEYLQSEESTIKEQKLAGKGKQQENETEDKQNPEALRNQQPTTSRPNLHKLFPKRNHPLKSSHSQTKPDDLGVAGSEIEEVKTSIPTNVQSEQTLNHKPFRSLPKHLLHRPAATDDSTQTSSTFESQRGTKGKITLPSPIQITKTYQNQDPTAAIMDEINVKAVSDMMKTNFTGRSTFSRRQRPMWHPQTYLHSMSGTNMGSSVGRTQHELKYQPQSTNTKIGGSSTLSDQTQVKTPENSQSIEHVTNSTAEVRGSRYVTRRRNQFRNQNGTPSTKFSTAVSMSQEQVFDTLKESKPQDARERPTYRRSQVRSHSGTPHADLAEQITATQSEQSFGRRRSKFRPRSKVENTTPTKLNRDNEPTDPKTTQPESIGNSPRGNTNFKTSPASSGEEPQASDGDDGDEDMEGSASEVQLARVRVRGRFDPPRQMERGFQPMFGELNVIGPVPAGFQDRARGFLNEELGLELPKANFNPQFGETDEYQFDAEEQTETPLRLLPPVFPVPKPPTSATSDTFSDDDLLPPLEKPMPLSISSKIPKEAEKIMNDQHRDITLLNQDFNQLKTRYDMLLNRYAETLKIYNAKYRNLFGSSEDSEK